MVGTDIAGEAPTTVGVDIHCRGPDFLRVLVPTYLLSVVLFAGLFLLISGLMWLAGGRPPSALVSPFFWAVIALTVVAGAAGLLRWYWKLAKNLAKNHIVVRLIGDVSGLTAQLADGKEAKIPWSRLRAAKRRGDLFLLFTSPRSFYIVPGRDVRKGVGQETFLSTFWAWAKKGVAEAGKKGKRPRNTET